MRDVIDIIYNIAVQIIAISEAGIGERINYTLKLLGESIRHLAEGDYSTDKNFHIWGDIAKATSELNLAKLQDKVYEKRIPEITKQLKKIALEFEVDEVPCRMGSELQELINFMNPNWKPRSVY